MTELELAERALAVTDGDAQVTVARERSLHARFARSVPTQLSDIDDVTVRVLVVRDGHAASASTNATSDEALRAAAAQATAAAQAAARAGRGDHPGLPGPQRYRQHAGHDAATAALDPGHAAAELAAAFAATAEHGLQAFGIWTAGEVRTAIAGSSGLRATDAVTDAYGKVIARDADGRSGFAADAAVAAAGVDLGALAREAAGRAPRGALEELAPGAYPVVLGAEAVGELLGFLGPLAFDGQAHDEGRGALSGRLGTAVAAPIVHLTDAPFAPRTLPRAFDGDGIPKRPLVLIEGGVARAVVHDTVTAAQAGTRTTGHAQPIGDALAAGPAPTNLVLAAGDADGVDALAAPIERGVYVHRFWYTNPVEPKETLLTGVTRDGTHLIEDGRITRPLRDVRFTDTILGILSRVEALGSRQRLVSAAEFYDRRFANGNVCPPVRVGRLNITG